MSEPLRPKLRRDHDVYTIFGRGRWWRVYLTPFQPVASFEHLQDAYLFAVILVIADQKRRSKRPPDG